MDKKELIGHLADTFNIEWVKDYMAKVSGTATVSIGTAANTNTNTGNILTGTATNTGGVSVSPSFPYHMSITGGYWGASPNFETIKQYASELECNLDAELQPGIDEDVYIKIKTNGMCAKMNGHADPEKLRKIARSLEEWASVIEEHGLTEALSE